jgi:hypothetical protein
MGAGNLLSTTELNLFSLAQGAYKPGDLVRFCQRIMVRRLRKSSAR